MPTRREFLKVSAAAALWPAGWIGTAGRPASPKTIWVNDANSQLNPTQVRRIVRPASIADVQAALRKARTERLAVSIAGARHAAGGQQFGKDAVLLDMTGMNRVLALDMRAGEIEVEAGIRWPELEDQLRRLQGGREDGWTVIQKQGVPRMTIGGTLGANAHGDGLGLRPIIADVRSFELVDARGEPWRCSREENAEQFRIVVGGYGLFGAVTSVRLKLAPRMKVKLEARLADIADVIPALERWTAEGFVHGAFDLVGDPTSDDYLRQGVLVGYRPTGASERLSPPREGISEEAWMNLAYLGHVKPKSAFEAYARERLSTSGHVCWSDDLPREVVYVEDYHREVDRRLGEAERATDLLFEFFVPRGTLVRFLEFARRDFRSNHVRCVFSTIRLIERDDESFLPWARESYACVVFYLHTMHTRIGIHLAAEAFRRLLDQAIALGGSYYLTYHPFATRRQVEACYPRFVEFLRRKSAFDPEERYQSDWYRHHRRMFADALSRPSSR